MSTPQAKRRRLNEASKTLHKPFKSPFRTPLKPATSSDYPSSDPPDYATPTDVETPSTPATPVTHTINPVQPTARFEKPLTSRPPTPSLRQKNSSKTSLAREVMRLRSDIQILTQAHALCTSTKDEDLGQLIELWRTASRAVAEELFASTRDRVNRMGGVGAWKEREREQKEWRMQRDREEFEAERERLEEAQEAEGGDAREFEDYGLENKQHVQEEEAELMNNADDDSFTMDIMLKTLNIDLQLIGYSKEAQRWEG